MNPHPKNKIILVNGIYSQGKNSVDQLGIRLSERGHKIRDLSLPLSTVATAILPYAQRRRAKTIYDAHAFGDSIIAHSNGVGLVYHAMTLGCRFRNVYLFNGAWDRKKTWCYNGAKRIYNIYSPFDHTLFLGRLIPHHPFGALGRVGYEGAPDDRIHDILNDDKCEKWGNHSCAFRPGAVERWADFVEETL